MCYREELVHLRSDRHHLAKVVLRKLTRCDRDPVGMLCMKVTHPPTHTHTHTHTQTHTGPGQLSGGQRHAPAADSGV
jgi:hypothetical protein